MRWIVNLVAAGLVLACAAAAVQADGPVEFAPAGIAAWSERSFEGATRYQLVEPAEAGAGHAALRADCSEATASGRLLEREIDLDQTPILEWRWRVDAIYDGLDERARSGDDYPARVYVVAKRWPAFRSRAINYVWSSGQPVGASWPNAFSDAFMMVSVQSGGDALGQWITERRDIRADFRRLHDMEIDTVDALAIMTDCDNAEQSSAAWYGPIRWLPAESAAD
jgi:hypothetical protein